MQPHSTLVTGAVVILFAAAAGATSPAAADDRALCFGQTATVVGTNGDPILTGTEGDDVVITTGAEVTETYGGDDLVCVTRAASTVQLGLGDDRVDTTALPKQEYVRLELGGGHDVVRGGAAREQVLAGDESASDPDRDNISTGAGIDSVFLDGSEATSHDTVSLGRGTDRVTFVGSAASENVRITVDEPWKIDVRLGGGNDQYIDDASSGGSSFDGGRGIDILISAFGRLPGGGGGLLDLRSGRLEESLGDDRVVKSAFHFEDVSALTSGRLTVRGTDGPNRMDASRASFGRVTMIGRGGNDLLKGGRRDDKLVGGPGYDRAKGSVGTDLCRAEIRHKCERR